MKYTIILITLVFLSCNSSSKPSSSVPSENVTKINAYEDLDITQFKNEVKEFDGIVIDVRTPKEIADGKINNAMEIDFYDKDFSAKLLALDRGENYYLYCKVGGRSSKAAQMMIDNGFENVHNLVGGYTEWKKVSE